MHALRLNRKLKVSGFTFLFRICSPSTKRNKQKKHQVCVSVKIQSKHKKASLQNQRNTTSMTDSSTTNRPRPGDRYSSLGTLPERKNAPPPLLAVNNLSELRSALNERLHPQIDPNDKFDSMSVRFESRLKHVAEPQPAPEFVDRGKRFDLSKRDHNPIFDTQLHHMQPRETTILNSSLATTRFHHGFQRSMEAQKNFYGRIDNEREAQTARRDKGISHDREVYIARRPELRVENANESGLNFKLDLKPVVPMIAKSDARRLRLLHEARSPFDPPPPPSVLRNVSARRRDQVVNEGLTQSRKLLSVGNTIQAMDGYAQSRILPEISEQRKKRVIQGHQMKSTFQLG